MEEDSTREGAAGPSEPQGDGALETGNAQQQLEQGSEPKYVLLLQLLNSLHSPAFLGKPSSVSAAHCVLLQSSLQFPSSYLGYEYGHFRTTLRLLRLHIFV